MNRPSMPKIRLPSEIVSSILRFALPSRLALREEPTGPSDNHNGLFHLRVLLTLTHVCQSWRKTVLADEIPWGILPCEVDAATLIELVKRASGVPFTILMTPSNARTQPFPEAAARITANAAYALDAAVAVDGLYVDWNVKPLKSLIMNMIRSHPHKFRGLQELNIAYWRSKKAEDLLPLFSAPALPLGLRTLRLQNCSIPLDCLTHLDHLTSIELELDAHNPVNHITPEQWRTVLTNLSNSLRILAVRYVDKFPHGTAPLPIAIAAGAPIPMKRLYKLNLSFIDCGGFASHMSYPPSIELNLHDNSFNNSGNQDILAMPVFNSFFALNAEQLVHEEAHLQLRYSCDESDMTLEVGGSTLEYTWNESEIPPEQLLGHLSPQVRAAVTHLNIDGYPEDTASIDYAPLSDAFPNVVALSLGVFAEEQDQRMMLASLLASQTKTNPAFPKVRSLGLDHFNKLRGGSDGAKDYLLAFMRKREARQMGLQTLRLGVECRISTACWNEIQRISPRCVVVDEELLSYHAGPVKRWYWANVWDWRIMDADDSDDEMDEE